MYTYDIRDRKCGEIGPIVDENILGVVGNLKQISCVSIISVLETLPTRVVIITNSRTLATGLFVCQLTNELVSATHLEISYNVTVLDVNS